MNFFYDLKQINEFTYSLKIHGQHILPIYKTIKKMLKTAYYDSETESIFFSAELVITFKQYISNRKLEIKQCIKIV